MMSLLIQKEVEVIHLETMILSTNIQFGTSLYKRIEIANETYEELIRY